MTASSKMNRKNMTLLMILLLLLFAPACGSGSQEVLPSMEIVLSGFYGGVYLAEWLGHDLKPRLLTDFHDTLLLVPQWTGVVDNAIAVFGSSLEPRTYKRAVYFVDPATGNYQKVIEEEGNFSIHAPAVSPGKQMIAFLSHNPQHPPPHWDVFIYDLSQRWPTRLLQGRAYAVLSWTPDGEQLTYDTPDGWIDSITLKTQRIDRLVQGEGPTWSPDGKTLAFHRANAVFTYKPTHGVPEEVHRRSSWQRPILGPLHWSPDSRYLSFTVAWDFLGLTSYRCVVVDVNSRAKWTVRTSGLHCGPWLAGK